MNCAILVPCYNHGLALKGVIDSLQPVNLPILIVNDGSDLVTTQIIDQLAEQYESVNQLHLKVNSGKGGAVIAGIKHLHHRGYTHALQVDADGQHDLEAIPKLLQAANLSPYKLISGFPIYGDSVPKARLYGRYATHISVWIETLSLQIKDSMIGFRIYPLSKCCELFAHKQLGTRMDFDIEVLVRLYWKGVDIEYIPVKVHYPEDGISHFSGVKDNLRISWLHTRLICGMLPRIPTLLKRNLTRNIHWSSRKENGSVLGMKLLFASYKCFGKNLFKWFLHPVIAYYYLMDHKSRRASKQFQLAVAKTNKQPVKSSYQHLYNFGEAMLDKLAAWTGQYSPDDITINDSQLLQQAVEHERGCLIIGSHLGNLEACRALSRRYTGLKMNAIVFTQHAEKFNAVMESVNKDSALNLIQVTELGPDTAILLEQKLAAGEWVVIVGDRTPVSQNRRVEYSSFMGERAPFPLGPFILASVLKSPTYVMFGFCEQNRINVHLEALPLKPLTRKHREQDIQYNIDLYASRLEHYALRYPLQWFNFFDFWKLDNE
ncbi:acyltransferase [Vibrio sp. 10N.286.49.B3]|uniref:glycosyltransferase family 2 protein n=1 Tax=Vibrio sp. 10N.286.49.B3 TaxID=1880855 RepID=UPI000C82D22E|nr:glycosyltransferase family 2 protein [Vibrio sp. 10N.286.49.B3]PMH44596.1 acyltransferase [Vibrio sp. 10N.286.49.B3]